MRRLPRSLKALFQLLVIFLICFSVILRFVPIGTFDRKFETREKPMITAAPNHEVNQKTEEKYMVTIAASDEVHMETREKPMITVVNSNEVNMPNSNVLITVALKVSKKSFGRIPALLKVYLRSLALFNKDLVNVILIMNSNFSMVGAMIEDWPEKYNSRLNITIVQPLLPPDHIVSTKNSQRLFLHEMFPGLSSVLYTDLDVIFIRPVKELFEEFKSYDEKQFIGMSGITPWCPKKVMKTNECYNAGLLLMNLTRMRNYDQNFTSLIMNTRPEFQEAGQSLNDQFILNYISGNRPEIRKILPFEWNIVRGVCESFNKFDKNYTTFKGWSLIHGTNWSFRDFSEFKIVYDLIDTWDMTENPVKLLTLLVRELYALLKMPRTQKINCPRTETLVDWISYYPSKTLLQEEW